MPTTPEAVAAAFSGHRFAEAYPALHQDIRWSLIGGPVIEGRAAVVEACESTAAELGETRTRFTRFETVVGGDAVVVDAQAEYEAADGSVTTVASCDLYRFDDDKVVTITSYNIELPAADQA